MHYTKLQASHISEIRALIPGLQINVESEVLHVFASDYTEDLVFIPDAVVFPTSTSEVSLLLAYCNEHLIAVTPRGAGTGLSGGSLPVLGGISLSLSKMNQILEIDVQNMQARVQPGVVNQELRTAVEAIGLYYPPDPASLGSCFLGGNIAHSSGGPRAVKYGTTKDFVLNLQVVLANGDIIWTGANTLKNSTGYNLTQLMVGSEGTLGVVTEIVFKLIPKPHSKLLLFTRFTSAEMACAFIPDLFLKGIVPSAMEFMETRAVEIASKATGVHVDTNGLEAFVLIELDGKNSDSLLLEAEIVYETLEKFQAGLTELADNSESMEKLWRLRRVMGEAVKQSAIYKEEDTVVPRFKLPALFNKVKELERKYGFTSVCYGHAGDGNLHVNILKENLTDEEWQQTIPLAIRELFSFCVEVGGTISGEHGIGLVQKDYIEIALSPSHIALMKGIKQVFDPHLILNPGKIYN
jgi:glycolate oxidase